MNRLQAIATELIAQQRDNQSYSRQKVKKFSNQNGSHLRRITSILKNVATYLSGGEPEKLLMHFLNKNNMKLKFETTVSKMLHSIRNLHDFSKKGYKTKILSTVAPYFPSSELKKNGFKFSSSSFALARKEQVWKKRFIPPSKIAISKNKKIKIHNFLMQHSSVASNKIKKIKRSEFYGNYEELEEPILKKKIKLTNGNDDQKCQNINVYCNSSCNENYFIQSQWTGEKSHQSGYQIFIANEDLKLGQKKLDKSSGTTENLDARKINYPIKRNQHQQQETNQNKNNDKNNDKNDQHGIINFDKNDQIEKNELENFTNCGNKTDNYIIIPKKKKQNKNNTNNEINNSINNINYKIQNKNISTNNIYQKNYEKKYDNNENMIDNDWQPHLVSCENSFYSHPFEQHYINDNHIKLAVDEVEKMYDSFIDQHMMYLDNDWIDLMFNDDDDDDDDDDENQISFEEEKTTKKKKEEKISVCPRFLNETIVWLHSKFIEEHPGCKMSLSTFWKNIPKYFLKNGKKRTDMCHLCEHGKKALKNFEPCIDPEIKKELTKTIEEFKAHFEIANRQRESFNKQRQFINQNEVVIICDFKENIKLGGGPNEMNQDYYSRQQCSVLCCTVAYYDRVLRKRKNIYVDYVSDVLTHDSVFVKDCLTHLVSNFGKICGNFKNVFPKKFTFWTDVGLHFRCQEFAHYVLDEFPKKFATHVEWNTFAECHGKSVVDGHFGLLSRWLKKIEKNQKIDSINTLIQCFEKKVESINKYKSPRDVLLSKFIYYEQNKRPKVINKLKIPNITKYYHFESHYQPNSHSVSIKIKMLTDSPYYLADVMKSIKVTEHKEIRQTKFGSKKTEDRKNHKMCFNEFKYGPNTSDRLRWQMGKLKQEANNVVDNINI